MKSRILVTLLLVASFVQSHAQTINKTYGHNALTQYSRCVIPKMPDSSIIWSASTYDTFSVNKILLTKVNDVGGFIKSILVDSSTDDHRIRETSDSCILLASYNNPTLRVFKFDQNLNRIWAVRLPIGANPFTMGSNTVDIEVAREGGQEYYYILSCAATYTLGYAISDGAFSVVKLRSNGQLVWHKVYAQNNRSADPAVDIWDVSRSLTLMDSLLVIGGTRTEVHTMWNPPMSVISQYLYYMTINSTGNIVTPYQRTMTADIEPSEPEVAWDRYNGQLISTYKERNGGSVPDPTVVSAVGFMAFTPGLAPTAGKVYWDSSQTFGNSITVNPDTNYVIGCFTEYVDNWTGNINYNPAYLKVGWNNNYSPIYFHRYNIHKKGINLSFHRNDNAGNNFMVPYIDNLNSTPLRTRLIKADNNGDACGSAEYPINELDFSPMMEDRDYGWLNYYAHAYFFSHDSVIKLTVDTCERSADPNLYRLTMSSQADEWAKVYPTNAYDATNIHCEMNLATSAQIVIQVYNSVGQVCFRQTIKATEGRSMVEIPAERLSRGLNLVTISKGSRIIKTEKIIR